MNKKHQLFGIISIVVIFFPKIAFAENTIFINEFVIDPQPQMVEILNNGIEIVDISSWYIDDSGGTTFFTIPQNSLINPNSCLIFSSDFNLNKASTDTIRLFNNFAPPTSLDVVLIDSYSYKSSPGTNISYIRLPDGTNNWSTTSASIGKFNQTGNSCIFITSSSTPTAPADISPTLIISTIPTITPTTTPIISPTPAVYNNIYISEIMAYPDSNQNEWVELYNDNNYSANLINWYIDDIENGGSSFKSFSLFIAAKSYGVVDLTTNMFNNDQDSVGLLDINKNKIDNVEYIDAEQAITFGRTSINSDELCLQQPSKGNINNECLNPTLIKTSNITTTTLTNSPTKIKTPTKANNPASFNQLNEAKNIPSKLFNNSNIIINQPASNENNILGASTSTINNFQLSLIKSLSFASCIYSLLTLFLISLKIRNSL